MAEQTFHLRGEYDLENASQLEMDLVRFARSEGGGGPLTIDAEHLRFIDSSGIAALIRARGVLASEGRTLRTVNVPPLARRVFDILGLDDMLDVMNGS